VEEPDPQQLWLKQLGRNRFVNGDINKYSGPKTKVWSPSLVK